MTAYNARLQPLLDRMPDRLRALPLTAEGWPALWFAAVDPATGLVDLRVARGEAPAQAWKYLKCWLCGQPLGGYRTFVIGPMCTVNRTSSEPPCHHDCATFAAIACPFLTKPRMVRNGKALPAETRHAPGLTITRNPGATALWTTRKPGLKKAHNGTLFDIGDPTNVEWFAQGRPATRAEVERSIETGLPLLEQEIEREPTAKRQAEARAHLTKLTNEARQYLPAA